MATSKTSTKKPAAKKAASKGMSKKATADAKGKDKKMPPWLNKKK